MTFETNSSSTHSITICPQETYEKWCDGRLLFGDWNKDFLEAEELTSCNNVMYFPQYDQYIDLSKGDVVAEINPNGQDISFTCWMGMIRGSIKVEK